MKTYLKNKYTRYERHIGAIGLVSGFVFDWFTLRRVDLLRENLWMLTLLLLAALGILSLNYHHKRHPEARTIYQHYSTQFWIIFIIQFAFGGILSAFLVLYFRSASLSAAWPFLLLLAAAFAGNEIFKERYNRLSYQVAVLYLAVFSFAIFALPVILHRLGAEVFLLSGLLSLLVIAIFVRLLRWLDKQYYQEHKQSLLTIIGALFVLINVLYFSNLIPPIPLSLKEAGVYHQVIRRTDGDYDALVEVSSWWQWLRPYQALRSTGGQVYVYSAVFSPTKLDTSVIHNWQRYDQVSGNWLEAGRVVLPIVGGRDGGYRTYSRRASLQAGKWRVNVETSRGQLIGRVKFKISPGQAFTEWQVLD